MTAAVSREHSGVLATAEPLGNHFIYKLCTQHTEICCCPFLKPLVVRNYLLRGLEILLHQVFYSECCSFCSRFCDELPKVDLLAYRKGPGRNSALHNTRTQLSSDQHFGGHINSEAKKGLKFANK